MIKFLHCSISSSSVYLFNNRTVQIQWQRWYKWSWRVDWIRWAEL